MANGVKYSTGSTPAGCLRKGNMLLAVGQQDYGTSFYSGVNPPAGGYTIYVNKATSGPSIHCARTDSDLIRLTNQIAGANYTTVSQCFNGLASRPDVIIVNRSYTSIVTDGLILNLDASFSASYPKVGTTWYDISGSNNNGQMVNGLAFNNGGWMDFDGVDDYVWIPYNDETMRGWADQQTIMVWEYHDFTTGRRNIWNQAYGGYGTWTHEGGSNVNYYWGNSGVNNVPYTSANSGETARGKWNVLCITRDNGVVNWYQNGVLTSSRDNPYAVLAATTEGITIGNGYAGPWQGRMSKILAYTRALNETEVFQNYIGETDWVIDGDYLKIFRHYSGTGEFFSSANDWEDAKNSNRTNPAANKYSILDRVADFLIDGKYTFKLNYPRLGITNIWSQTNNPVVGDGSGGVTGYSAISIDTSVNGWGGLERYDPATSTFLDGTLSPQGNWYYAVGVKDAWGEPTTFPGPNPAVDEVELWIKYK